jgi:hypothetical protein
MPASHPTCGVGVCHNVTSAAPTFHVNPPSNPPSNNIRADHPCASSPRSPMLNWGHGWVEDGWLGTLPSFTLPSINASPPLPYHQSTPPLLYPTINQRLAIGTPLVHRSVQVPRAHNIPSANQGCRSVNGHHVILPPTGSPHCTMHSNHERCAP